MTKAIQSRRRARLGFDRVVMAETVNNDYSCLKSVNPHHKVIRTNAMKWEAANCTWMFV